MDERRGYPRLKMYAGVFITKGEDAYLAEVANVSTGGATIRRPGNWPGGQEGPFMLFFVLEQERILCLKARVVHEQDAVIGFEFDPDYEIQAEQLVAESRNWR